jgi:transposase-like protein
VKFHSFIIDTSECKGSCGRQNNKGLRRSYDSNFKLMVIREAEKTNNCAASRKFSITENNVRRWQQQKDKLSNARSTRMAFRGPKGGSSMKLMSLSLNS